MIGRMSRALAMLATIAAAAIVASSFGGARAAFAAGPCLPPGVKLPPGSPHIPPCKKPKPKPKPTNTVRLDIEISGGMTVTDASHQGDQASCGVNSGGGSKSTGTTEINFGQERFATTRAGLDRKKRITRFTIAPIVRMTYNPTGQEQHWSPPDCALQTDPTNCTQKEEGDTVTVAGIFDTKAVPDKVKVTLSPSSVLTYGEAHCPAPLFDGWALLDSQGTVTFTYQLDELDIGQFGLLLGPKHKKGHSTMTLDWKVPGAPCSEHGGPKTPFAQAGGALDSCTLKADFRLVVRRVD